VQFVTGQLQNGSIDLNWTELISPGKTVFFYMGLSTLPMICGSLIAHCMEKAMPVALIEKGTTSEQRVIVSTLDQLPNILKAESVSSPSLLIVGQVVQLSKKLDWFTPSSV
jgi:uroporphyrin-III C-methyltransferase/precorrin-2 dehydrogenase/sirohydrochlorin ferrochelatase